jgi:hypothetical protein
VRTVKGLRVATSGLSNCMGVVVHSPLHGKGCLAHIEAEPQATYAATFKVYIDYMIAKTLKYGGAADPNMQVALFGNRSGPSDAQFTADIMQVLTDAGIQAGEISDQRNTMGGGPHHFAGAQPRIPGASGAGAIAYDPTTGTVEFYLAGAAGPGDSRHSSGIRRKKLQ